MVKVFAAAVAACGVVALGVGVSAPDSVDLGQRRSCGYHCQPDGGSATPAAPPERPEIQEVGRANVHSGGREGGKGDKRHGGGGQHNPFTDEGVLIEGEFVFTGRTDVHSGGREHNTAQPRHGGGPQNPKVTKGVRKL